MCAAAAEATAHGDAFEEMHRRNLIALVSSNQPGGDKRLCQASELEVNILISDV